MMRKSLALIGLAAAAGAAAQLSAECDGPEGICEEELVGQAERASILMQRTSQATPLALAANESEGKTVDFTIDADEFKHAYEAIMAKLKASGMDMSAYDPHFLTFTTSSGGALDGEPVEEDFPLKFHYEVKPPSEAVEHSLVEEGADQGFWPFRDPAGQRPNSYSYTSTQEDLDFTDLAEHVYHLSGGYLPPNWTVAEHVSVPAQMRFPLVEATDRVALYTKDGTCALAISGSDSNDIGDWMNNFNGMFTKHFCGSTNYHMGFVDETEQIINSKAFQDRIAPKAKRCSRVVVIGHSLGGAVASILAECLNSRARWSRPSVLNGFADKEVELYTFGAPGTRKGVAATNGQSWSGEFKGKRFFSFKAAMCQGRYCAGWCCPLFHSWAMQDPIPWLASTMGFVHPKIDAVGLDEEASKTEFWRAGNANTWMEPDTFLPGVFNPLDANMVDALVKEHLCGLTYKPRLESLLR